MFFKTIKKTCLLVSIALTMRENGLWGFRPGCVQAGLCRTWSEPQIVSFLMRILNFYFSLPLYHGASF